LRWQIFDGAGQQILEGSHRCDLVANASQRITSTDWEVNPASCATIKLQLISASGKILSENAYSQPFRPQQRPRAYPWKFDTYLGTKVFDRPDAASLAEQSTSPILKIIPLGVREALAEWILRQRVPVSLLSRLAHIVDSVMN
jgi:hypothetical protein